jgi:cation-transporting ATPase 13A1
LLVFALLASGNVFINGMKDGKRSQYELVLRCVLILTSVVPPELPMQTAMAVNTALIALMRASVFCTEPFRVPIAGKVDTCLFDKTGTLTSDKLVATGVVTPLGTAGKGYSQLTKCPAAPKNASLVIAGCHSLVQIDGKTFGDPLEQAALMGVKWRFNPKTQTSLPTEDFKDLVRDKALLDAETKRAQFIASLPAGKPHPPPVPKPVAPTRTWQGKPSVKILQRNHFSSVLQRMSTVAVVTKTTGATPEHWVCMKGSPEMVATLLQEKPSGYDGAYRALAEEVRNSPIEHIKSLPDCPYSSCEGSITTRRAHFQSLILWSTGPTLPNPGYTCAQETDTFLLQSGRAGHRAGAPAAHRDRIPPNQGFEKPAYAG